MIQIGLLGAFFGGILSLVSPCSALLLPSFFAYAFDSFGRLVLRTAAFYLGLVLVLVPLGAGLGAMGSLLTEYRTLATTIGGFVLIVLGVMAVLGKGFAFKPAQRTANSIKVSNNLSVVALGAVYGLAGFCSGPLLGSVLTVAMTGGQPAYGGLLMALYAFGMTLPLLLLAVLWDRFNLSSNRFLRGRELTIGPVHTHTISLVSGLLFIGIGLLFLLTDGTASLGAVMGVDSQFSLQVWFSDIADKVPDLAIALIVVLVLAGALAVRAYRRSRPDPALPTQGDYSSADEPSAQP